MLIKEGIYLGTRLSPAFHLFLAPRLPSWGGAWGRAWPRGRMEPSPAGAPHQRLEGQGETVVPRSWLVLSPHGKETSGRAGCKGEGSTFFPGKAGKWVSGSIIGASLPWIHPRAFATTLTPISRVENSLFGITQHKVLLCPGQRQLPCP